MAFRVAPAERAEVKDYLRERELVTHVYKERTMPVQLSDGRRVPALAYVIDRNHVQYAGTLTADAAAATVATAVGKSGHNREYVLNTLAHLREMGIRDHWLEEVAANLIAGEPASAQA
jgi:cation transport protein ChaC